MSARIPVTILSGFLGSGKTTLLNRLLRENQGRRVAVIVNEFGEVGIDGAVANAGDRFVELDNGCLCCAVNEDLQRSLADLKERGGFDHLVLETTGVADPVPVAWTFARPGLSDAYRVDAVVTVVDTVNLEHILAHSAEAADQIARADIIVLSKLDLLANDGVAVEAVQRRLRELNDLAPMLEAQHGQTDWQLLLTSDEPSRLADLTGTAPVGHHSHYDTWAYETEHVLDDASLEEMLYEIPPEVYRFKALVRTNAEWDWTLVNAVAGRFDLQPCEPTRPPAKSRLVFIGHHLDKSQLQRLCDSLPRSDSAPR